MELYDARPPSVHDPEDAGSSTSNDDRQRPSPLYKHSLPPRKRGRNFVQNSDVTSDESDAFEANNSGDALDKHVSGGSKNPKQKRLHSDLPDLPALKDALGYFQGLMAEPMESRAVDNPMFRGSSAANLSFLAEHVTSKQFYPLGHARGPLKAAPLPSPQSSDCKSTVSVVGVDDPLEKQKSNSPSPKVSQSHGARGRAESNDKYSQIKPLPFACSLCMKRFPTAQALGGHQNAHKNDSVFSMVKPGKSLYSMKSLKVQSQETGKRRHFSLVPRFDSTQGGTPVANEAVSSAISNPNSRPETHALTPFPIAGVEKSPGLSGKHSEEKPLPVAGGSLPVPCCNWNCNYFSMPCKQKPSDWRLEGSSAELRAKHVDMSGDARFASEIPSPLTQALGFVEKDFVGGFSIAPETKLHPRSGVGNLDLELRL